MLQHQLQLKIERLKSILEDRATYNKIDKKLGCDEFKELRNILITDQDIKDLLPKMILENRSLEEFWSFIKPKGGYGERRQYIRDNFNDVLSFIESIPVPFSDDPNVSAIIKICDRFHLIDRQIRNRQDKRPTLEVNDEYDVQDLLHALLKLHFDDIRAEEHSPSYAGISPRLDFLLKNEKIVIEVKKTRRSLVDKKLSEEIIEDKERYQSHTDCRMLVFFVYDPEHLLKNPQGLENDLNRDIDPFPVRVLIRP